MSAPANILVLGASYGLLPGVKLARAGHSVTFVGRDAEIASMAPRPIEVHIPSRHAAGDLVLAVPVVDRAVPGGIALRTPAQVDCTAFDLIVLAMQEPQFAEPEVAKLMMQIAAARRPCLSIMNLAPPPFLTRLGIDARAVGAGVYRCAPLWDAFDPAKFTLASPDPQAIRPDQAAPGRLRVTLASNFKAAPFALPEDQALLQRLASDMSHLKMEAGAASVRPPVALVASASRFAPLAKWPMLIAGNIRCVRPSGARTIAETVLGDVAESAALYDQVLQLARRLGAAPHDLVSFESYARAAARLTRPSSLAAALEAGAVHVERVDLLIARLMHLHGVPTDMLDPIVALIEARLSRNRAIQAR